jgi:hypothetical protein
MSTLAALPLAGSLLNALKLSPYVFPQIETQNS